MLFAYYGVNIKKKVFFPGFYIPLKFSINNFKIVKSKYLVLVMESNNFIYDIGVVAKLVDFKVEKDEIKTIYKTIYKCKIKSKTKNNKILVEIKKDKKIEDGYLNGLRTFVNNLNINHLMPIFNMSNDFNEVAYYIASNFGLDYKNSLKLLASSDPGIKTNIIKNFLKN